MSDDPRISTAHFFLTSYLTGLAVYVAMNGVLMTTAVGKGNHWLFAGLGLAFCGLASIPILYFQFSHRKRLVRDLEKAGETEGPLRMLAAATWFLWVTMLIGWVLWGSCKFSFPIESAEAETTVVRLE